MNSTLNYYDKLVILHGMQKQSYLTFLLIVLFIKAILIAFITLFAGIGLGPDEAQYWTWSQSLDWGYYSKPPGIAWQIWAGTSLFGNTEFGVRFGSIVIGILIPLSIYKLGRACLLSAEYSFWAAILFAFSPLGFLGSFLAITDGGLVLFWTLGCAVIAESLTARKSINYILLGICIFLGALFKWPIYILWGLVVGWVLVRSMISKSETAKPSWKFFAGFGLSLLGFLPILIWNMDHDWATFRHVFSTMAGGPKEPAAGNFPSFFGSQALLFSPVFFVFLLIGFWRLPRMQNEGIFFCGIATLVILAGYSFFSVFQKMQGNWCVFAYPTAAVFVAWVFSENPVWGKRWLIIGALSSLMLCLAAFAIPVLQKTELAVIPYKFSPFRHNVGWDRLGPVLQEAGYNPATDFVFADKYQLSSIASFYAQGQQRAYFLNLQKSRKNQFSYWSQIGEDHPNSTGFFIQTENSPHFANGLNERIAFYQKNLEDCFSIVEFVGAKPLHCCYGELNKGALIFRCSGWKGSNSDEPELY